MADYEVIMTKEQIKAYPSPHIALESLTDQLKAKIEADNQDPLHYITTAYNEGDGFKMTADYSEERKKHFEAMTPEELAKIRG